MLGAFLMEPFRLNRMNKSSSLRFDSQFRNHSYLGRGLYSKQLRKVYNTVLKKKRLVLRQEELQHHHEEMMVNFLISWIFPLMTSRRVKFLLEKNSNT
jgi:hypothetical protein